MNSDFMREKPVLPLVLSMSLPMVISMLVNSLYNIVDSYFVAKISENAMTALSLVYPLQIFISAAGVGFGIGINAVAAYYLGAQRQDRASKAASLGIILSILHGVLLTVVCILLIPRFLRLFTQNADVMQCGLDYSYIVFAFCVPITLGIAFEKIFQAEGQMVISMISMMSGCIANIILDPIMIFGIGPIPAMGIKGAALATGTGQIIPLAVYIIFYFAKPLPIKLYLNKKMMDTQADAQLLRRIYAVGIPAALNMALPSLLITVLNGILASFSQTYVLVLGIYYKLQTFIYLTANGIVQGMRPIIGYNYGAREFARVRKIFFTALKLTLGVMAAGMAVCFTAAQDLTALFTSSPGTISAGKTALRIISCGFIVSAVSVTAGGALEGLGRGMSSLAISLMRYTVIIIPVSFLLSRWLGPAGVWHAFWVSETIAAAAAALIYKKAVAEKNPDQIQAKQETVCK